MPDPRDSVSVERIIAAPPEPIFAVLADPARHPEIDASGSVKAPAAGAPTRLSLGATFQMSMKRRIWRYTLEPVDGGTRVTETWDISKEALRPFLRLVAVKDTRKSMEKSLENLEALVTRS
jgi:uncharacterized protein YndB with AHSA1/START domain